jgi:hypothetical protein
MQKLIQQLFDGPIDIIGDIHGEYGALCALLTRLGYDGNGNHLEGRRLVFVGDLVDRGPGSLSVVQLLKTLVDSGKAQCILGNHELNLIKTQAPKHRHGNHWFFGETECMTKEAPQRVHFQELANESQRAWISEWLGTLPLALEHEQLRIVHACWDQSSVDRLRNDQAQNQWANIRDAYEFYKVEIEKSMLQKSQTQPISSLEKEIIYQNEHPIKVLCSGLEEHCSTPYFAGGKMRYMKRVTWWDRYQDSKKVIFGHYWRKRFKPQAHVQVVDQQTVPVLFDHHQPYHWLGQNRTAMCIDYSIGQSFFEREKGILDGASGMALCAMRWPQEELWFHDGMKQSIID